MVCEDGCVLEGEGCGCGGLVEEDLVGGFGQEKVEVDVILAREVLVDWLC